MPRLQKVTEKVFAEIAETPQKKAAYVRFLHVDAVTGNTVSGRLYDIKEVYRELVTEHKDVISTLAALEEIIIQIRCKGVINEELRLSLSRNYIYARSIFFRRGNQINDIRVVVGTTESYGDDLNKLIKDPEFRNLCITKIGATMEREINDNINHLNRINEKIKST